MSMSKERIQYELSKLDRKRSVSGWLSVLFVINAPAFLLYGLFMQYDFFSLFSFVCLAGAIISLRTYSSTIRKLKDLEQQL